MSNISTIGKACVGCRSCEQICPKQAIAFKENSEGFLYPYVQSNKCVDCSLCMKRCPIAENRNNRTNVPISVFAFRDKDDEQIMESASGGVGVLAAQVILQNGGIAYGAAYDNDLRVKHICIDSLTELHKLQSSKYVQSDTNNCYKRIREDLEGGKLVLFSGTPCQVAGLKIFLSKEYSNLYTIDLICHGVPSPKLFQKYLEWKNQQMKGKIISYNFRSKARRGWGTQYLLKIKTKTKTKTKILALDKYGKHFMAGDCYREGCYQCPYANVHRVGDLTIGDFWGIGKSHPEFHSEKGVSSVFVNTEQGQKLFGMIKGYAFVLPATLEEAMIKQGNLINPTQRPKERDSFYHDIENDDFVEQLKVGLQPKTRVKALLPRKFVAALKKIL